jgi:hypothetical protein
MMKLLLALVAILLALQVLLFVGEAVLYHEITTIEKAQKVVKPYQYVPIKRQAPFL